MTERSLTEYREARCHDIEENIKEIRDNIAEAAIQNGRNPEDVHLMAVTKTVEPYFINHALHCGIDLIGENRVQEFLGKKPELDLDGVDCHLIGHLQTNKVRQIVGEVSTILLEVNVGEEESKSGMPYEAVADLLPEIAALPGLSVEGFMAIPPICEDDVILRGYFSKMNQLYVDMKDKNIDNININTLSMGMSADYVQAILEGSTLVRVGSSLFGARVY